MEVAMTSVAVLLDGGYVRHSLYSLLGRRHPNGSEIRSFALKCVDAEEMLFRIYYYDAYPFTGVWKNPVDGRTVDFSATQTAKRMNRMLREISLLPNVAFRYGQVALRGYCVKESAWEDLLRGRTTLTQDHVRPELTQKAIDMKIGLDIAWLASKRIVDKVILVTADRDFLPAMKFARREGLQVVVIDVGRGIHPEFKEHSDEHRLVKYP